MGYETDVIFALDKRLVPYFLVFAAEEPFFIKTLFTQFTLNKDYLGEGHYLFHLEKGEWSKKTESQFLDLIINLEENEKIGDSLEERSLPGVSELFRYIMIGEDMDDYSDKGWAFMDEIHIQRSIKF